VASDEGINLNNPAVDPGIDNRLQTKSIADTLESIKECRAFAGWVRKAGLDYLLRRSGLHTLFAPEDAIFQGPDDAAVSAEFLNRYLLEGALGTFDLSRCNHVKTASGDTLQVSEKGRRIGNAHIIRRDIACTNGTIHLIDGAL
jgi:uncharacterized surface protein with fasciclin (FAS1) repeats